VLYSSSLLYAYLIASGGLGAHTNYWVNGSLIVLLAVLMLTIRVTRREDFPLNTQDLLILLVVILIPLLPFESLDQHSVGRIALTLSVLLYASEFILSRGVRTVTMAIVGVLIGLVLVGFSGIQSLV
jgi:UDP-GlcNAc:undecaprenyl-phosphate GlcNAc-1-phosphate transferase